MPFLSRHVRFNGRFRTTTRKKPWIGGDALASVEEVDENVVDVTVAASVPPKLFPFAAVMEVGRFKTRDLSTFPRV